MVFYLPPDVRHAWEIGLMSEKTCAACDCKLEGDVISVNVGGKAVEVCCEECARSLKEAFVSTAGPKERR
jgi:hypothetical protein